MKVWNAVNSYEVDGLVCSTTHITSPSEEQLHTVTACHVDMWGVSDKLQIMWVRACSMSKPQANKMNLLSNRNDLLLISVY